MTYYYRKVFTSFHGIMQRDLTAPYVDDGLIEVVGFRDAWHGLVLLAPNGHGTRLAQVKYSALSSINVWYSANIADLVLLSGPPNPFRVSQRSRRAHIHEDRRGAMEAASPQGGRHRSR